MERIRLLCPNAVLIHYRKEEQELYFRDLEQADINYDTPLSGAFLIIKMLKHKYFGYAHDKFTEWWLGFIKLQFSAKAHGKIHARNIDVTE